MGSDGTGGGDWRKSFEVTDYLKSEMAAFEEFSGQRVGAKIFRGWVSGGRPAVAVGGEIILNDKAFFALAADVQTKVLGHEFWHVIQDRTIAGFDRLYEAANSAGSFRNPYEVTAEAMGAAYASRVHGTPVPMDLRYLGP